VKQKTKGFLLAIFSVVVVVIGQLILKYGLNQVNADFSLGATNYFIQVFSNFYVLFALVLLAVNGLTWLLALSKIPLSFAYPVLSIGYVVVSGFSWLFFNENLSSMRIFGLGIVVIGVFVMSRT